MTLVINYITQIIFVPQADLTFVSGTLYSLDTDAFRLELKDIEDSEEGVWALDTHRHVTNDIIAGVTDARKIIIINGYMVEFEDGQYAVRLEGSNNNIFDEGIIVRNQVSIIPTNSFGLITVSSGSGLSPVQSSQLEDLHQFRGLDDANPLEIDDDEQRVAGKVVDVSDDGTTTTVDRQ